MSEPPPAADATSLLLHLEQYLGRLVNLVETGTGDAGSPPRVSTMPAARSAATVPELSSAPPTAWLANELPPDVRLTAYVPPPPPPKTQQPLPPPSVHYLNSQAQPVAPQPTADTTAANPAAEKFLKDLEQLIKTFLSQQQLGTAPRAAAAPGPPVTLPAPAPALSKEAEARAEVLRKAVAAADAEAAAREFLWSQTAATATATTPKTPKPNINHSLLRQIDHQWDAAISENNSLKEQLGQAGRQQDQLLQAKQAAEKLLREKEALLGKIRDCILDLKTELARHKIYLEQQAVAQTARAAKEADEKQAMIQQLRLAIADLETQLRRLQQEKTLLEADLQRTTGEKRGLESDLSRVQGEKVGLESDLQRTHQALQTHRNLKTTLEQSFMNAETEVQAMRSLLQQLDPHYNTTAGAPAPPSSAFQPTSFPTAPIQNYHVQTVYDEPPPKVTDGLKYDFQQHQAPWPPQPTTTAATEPSKPHTWEPSKKSVWEGPPKEPLQPQQPPHAWHPIQKPGVYHVQVPPHPPLMAKQQQDPQGHGSNSPEWTEPQPEQPPQPRIIKQQPSWTSYDPPAEQASVNTAQQHQWRRADPAAVDQTGSYGYPPSSAGGGSLHPMLESIDEGSYYAARSQQEYYRHAPTTWTTQSHQSEQQPWSNYPPPQPRTPQEPPMTISTHSPSPTTQGRMAYLQEQMANAVDDARTNGPNQQPPPFRGPNAKLPLQPPPAASPERERWSPASSSQQEAATTPRTGSLKPNASPWR